MLKWWKSLGPDIKIAILLIGISGVLMLLYSVDVKQLFITNLALTIKILYLTVVAIAITTVIHFLVPVDFAEKYLKNNSILYLFYATFLGTLTPGPVYAIYPIVLELRRKGVSNAILVAFLTGQTIIGPARAPFEIGFFGLKFYLFRILLALVMGPVAGLLYIAFSRLWPDIKEIKS